MLIEYNNSAFGLRFEIPANWDTENISGINIQIATEGGTELLAATAATLYTATTLNGAVSIGGSTITLASGTATPGDVLRIADSASGEAEDIVVKYANGTAVTLERELASSHATGTAVVGMYAIYDLDTSTVATWTKNLRVVVTWTPDTDDIPLVQHGEVYSKAVSLSNLRRRFNVLYNSEYEAIKEQFEDLSSEALKQLEFTLKAHGVLMYKVVDSDDLIPLVMAWIRRAVAYKGGDRKEYEHQLTDGEYQRILKEFCNMPIWTDDDQDGIKDDDEVDDHSDWQLLNSERGI